jgi:hypothetical protein
MVGFGRHYRHRSMRIRLGLLGSVRGARDHPVSGNAVASYSAARPSRAWHTGTVGS